MSKYDDLVQKLKEIFQIDRPELDFGVYRILNSRVVEINDYLDNAAAVAAYEAVRQQLHARTPTTGIAAGPAAGYDPRP